MAGVKYHPEVDILEHDDSAEPRTKRVLMYGWDSSGLQKVRIKVDGNGIVQTSSSGSATTSTLSSVNDTASSTTILASNSSRLGATVFNDSSALLYLLFGSGTASSTNYTVRVYPNGYYEVPAGFIGQLTGVWASDPNDGAARVTELT